MKITYSTTQEIPRWLCLLIGLVFITISVFMIKSDIDTKNSMDSQTQSYMVTHQEERRRQSKGHGYKTLYRPIYHYNVYGENYSCTSNTSASYKSNKNKTIYYKSNKPQSCFVDEGVSGMFIKGVFLLFGLIPIFLCFQKKSSS